MRDTMSISYKVQKKFIRHCLALSIILIALFWFGPYWIWCLLFYGFLPSFFAKKIWALAWFVIPIFGIIIGNYGVNTSKSRVKFLFWLLTTIHVFNMLFLLFALILFIF